GYGADNSERARQIMKKREVRRRWRHNLAKDTCERWLYGVQHGMADGLIVPDCSHPYRKRDDSHDPDPLRRSRAPFEKDEKSEGGCEDCVFGVPPREHSAGG